MFVNRNDFLEISDDDEVAVKKSDIQDDEYEPEPIQIKTYKNEYNPPPVVIEKKQTSQPPQITNSTKISDQNKKKNAMIIFDDDELDDDNITQVKYIEQDNTYYKEKNTIIEQKTNNQSNNQTYKQKLNQQRDNIQQKEKNVYSNTGVTVNQKYSQSNQEQDYYKEIDFQKLQTIVKNDNNQNIYEPGAKQNIDNLPVLEPMNNKFEVQARKLDLEVISNSSDDQKYEPTKKYEKQEQEEQKVESNNKQEEESKNDDDEEGEQVQIIQQDKNININIKAQLAKPIENLQIVDMKSFLTQPCPKGVLLQCTIKRDKSGISNKFYPKYHVYLSSGFTYLMSGKKRSGNKTSNYMISMDKNQFNKKQPSYIGKVRSNFLGTEFHVYDSGENYKECKFLDKIRSELAVIIYESNLLGARGPRKMRCLIPDVKPTGEPSFWRPVQDVDQHDDEIIYLQFGRVGNDMFNMDVQWPMTPLQAFGICLSSFDYKIACE